MVIQTFGRSMRGARVPLVALAVLAALPFACHASEPSTTQQSQSPLSAPTLGVAASFLVLGGSTVTNTGATTVAGDLGVNPGLAITGFPPGLLLGGAEHAGDVTALQAQNDVTAAYVVLAGDACAFDLTGKDLGGRTLTQGVYCFSSEALLTGQLVLDAQGDPSAVWVFKIASTLTTASSASVAIVNGGQECRVFWQVGSSATLGTDTVFAGNILALTSVALQTRVSLSGRALARNGAVTMDTNHVSRATCATPAGDAGVDGSGGADGSGGSVSDGGDAGDASDASDSSDAGDAGPSLCCHGILCGASCIDLSADVANCGACGHKCASDEFCAAGSCVLCSPVCGGACVDLTADHANCGSCGNVCLSTQSCTGSACVTCANLCVGACVNLAGDHANCGSCGNACLVSEVCTGSVCVACPALCGGACASLDSDSSNCGSCGHSCAPGEACKGGSCVCP